MRLKVRLKLLYEDNHLIAVEKQPGTLTQEAALDLPVLSHDVKAYLKEKYNKPGAVYLGLIHRLDTNVGGVICFAKTSKAAARLSQAIRKQQFEKKYLAIVEGHVHQDETIVLTHFLKKDEEEKKAIVTNSTNGKESILKFKRLAQLGHRSLLEVQLMTGRFHQIRAQLAHHGIPIFGDAKYGTGKPRTTLALYAYHLHFNHPTKKEKITIKHLPKNDLFSPFLKAANLQM